MGTRVHTPTHRGVSVWLAALAAALGLGACTPTRLDDQGVEVVVVDGGPGARQGSARVAVWADWDDLDASIGTGLTPAEAAPLETTSSDAERTWALVTIDNHRGLLVVTRDPTAGRDGRGCELLTIRAEVDGPRGAERARLLVAGTRQRLLQLAGVDWAPR